MRCLMIVPGSEIIGAFLKLAFLPLSSLEPSQGSVPSYLEDESLMSVGNAPLALCFTDGEWESFGGFLFAKGAVENAREGFSVV